MINATQRFSSRVENYIKYRPHYPPEAVGHLVQACRLTAASVVADIGSGTGILTELFLKNGNPVFAVEPNREMREAGERLLRDYPLLRTIEGRAEATTLPDHSVDVVAAGQAFHWFDRERARGEFSRVLKPAGWVVLVWNERQTGSTPFLQAYEELVKRHAADYAEVDHRKIDRTSLQSFFGAGQIELKTFDHHQEFDHEGVQGRLLSSSYMPEQGDPRYGTMLAELVEIFGKHERGGSVLFEYITMMYYGRIG